MNLPEADAGRWGVGLTAKKMSECRWGKPEVVAQFEFVEWTEGEHLRHAKYVGLRDDKNAQAVVREPEANESPCRQRQTVSSLPVFGDNARES